MHTLGRRPVPPQLPMKARGRIEFELLSEMQVMLRARLGLGRRTGTMKQPQQKMHKYRGI